MMKHKRRSATLISLAFLLCSCGSLIKNSKNEVLSPAANDPNVDMLVIAGINDFHGALAPTRLLSSEQPGAKPTEYSVAGAAVLGTYLKIARNQHAPHFLILDAGDQYQGALESNLHNGAPVVQFYNAIGVTAAAVGDHEFDFGDALRARMSESRFAYLTANILDRTTSSPAFAPLAAPSTLVQAGQYKIGIIGLASLVTPFRAKRETIQNLKFISPKDATLKEAKRLREQGANLVVITGHLGLNCRPRYSKENPMRNEMRGPQTLQGSCGEDDELTSLLKSLPPGTIDAVVSGHSHTIVHHWVEGVPVIQSGSSGRYVSFLHLPMNRNSKKLIAEHIRIEGPVPVCEKVFEKQGDCDGQGTPPNDGRGDLVRASFRGNRISPDGAIEKLLEPTIEATQGVESRVIGKSATPLTLSAVQENTLGNLVADAIREQVHADFALINPGGMRAPLPEGPITYGDLYRTLPYDTMISVIQVTGIELKNILRIANNGARGFFPVSGMQVRLIDLPYEAKTTDLDHNRKISHWETNRLIDVRLPNGDRIHDFKLYRLATTDYLASGGDDLAWAIAQIPSARIMSSSGILVRDAVLAYLSQRSPVNTPEAPLLQPGNRRIVLLSGPVRSKKSSPKARRRKSK